MICGKAGVFYLLMALTAPNNPDIQKVEFESCFTTEEVCEAFADTFVNKTVKGSDGQVKVQRSRCRRR